jgi:hypothetical protein
MATKISDTEMTSDITRHTATHTDDGWTVTWLPGRTLTRDEAITAMTVAEMVIERAQILADRQANCGGSSTAGRPNSG